MKCVRNILIYTLNVMIQVSVIAFKNTWENWGNYFVFHEKILTSLFFQCSGRTFANACWNKIFTSENLYYCITY
jgi:hypothetical protein